MRAAAATMRRTLEVGTAVGTGDTPTGRTVGLDRVGIASNKVARANMAMVLWMIMVYLSYSVLIRYC
jgi:hypothetical protein